jgi:four helix bundle protein
MGRKVNRFEDLIAWQKARLLTKAVHTATRSKAFERDRSLRDQLFRAARSVMANIAEGFDRAGSREFHKGLSTSTGSCAEVRSDLYVAYDVGYLTEADFQRLYDQAAEVSRIVGALRAAVARQLSKRP